MRKMVGGLVGAEDNSSSCLGIFISFTIQRDENSKVESAIISGDMIVVGKSNFPFQ